MLGLLPPSSKATFFMLPAADRMISLPGVDAARQGHEVDRRALGEGPADPLARAEDEVADTGRQARLLDEAHEVDRSEWRQLGGLEDERVAGGEGRRDLPGDLQERVVPRSDEGADADRLVDDPAQCAGRAGGHQPAGVLVGETGVVAEDADRILDVVAPLAESLAGVARLLAGDLLEVTLEQVGDTVEEQPTLRGGRGRPRPMVEGVTSGRDGPLDVAVVGDVDARQGATVERGDDHARLTGRTGRPAAVDVQVRHALPLVGLGRLRIGAPTGRVKRRARDARHGIRR